MNQIDCICPKCKEPAKRFISLVDCPKCGEYSILDLNLNKRTGKHIRKESNSENSVVTEDA